MKKSWIVGLIASIAFGGIVEAASSIVEPAAKWGTADGRSDWTQYALDAVKSFGTALWAPGFNPRDIDTYCPSYRQNSPENRQFFWVGFISALAELESGYDPKSTYQESFFDKSGKPVVSRGLLQISQESANAAAYNCNIGKPEDLYDPQTNLRCAVKILNYLVPLPQASALYIAAEKPKYMGAAGYWEALRRTTGRAAIAGWTSRQPYCVKGASLPDLRLDERVADLVLQPRPPAPVAAPDAAAAPAPTNVTESAVATAGSNVRGKDKNPIKLEIVRFIGADESAWKSTQAPADLADLYTRVLVYNSVETSGNEGESNALRAYDSERRSALGRLISDRTINMATTAKTQIRDPDIDLTLPLFAIEHDSVKGTGETFITSYTGSHVQAPLFRIGPNTTMTIHLSAQSSDQKKVTAIASILSAVQSAVTIAAPHAAILTTLSAPELSKASTALDGVISGLMSETLSEDIEIGRLLDGWQPGYVIAVNAFVSPGLIKSSPPMKGETVLESTEAGDPNRRNPEPSYIGTWYIQLACPRPSIFFSENLCAPDNNGKLKFPLDDTTLRSEYVKIERNVSASRILQTQLSSQVSVQQFILSSTWYTDFTNKKGATTAATDVQLLCTNTLQALYAAGLNEFDSELVLEAMNDRLSGLANLPDASKIKTARASYTSYIAWTMDPQPATPPAKAPPAKAAAAGKDKG